MTIQELLLNRESCRKYKNLPVKREDLIKIAEAGRLSPSGCNAQPWKFIIVDGEKEKEYVRDAVVVPSGDTGAPWRHNVGAFILLVEQKAKVMKDVLEYYQDSQVFARGDLGMAALNMQYQAMELGLGSCLIGMCDQSKMEQYFQIPHGDMVRMTLAIGYSDETGGPRKKIRKPFEEVCSFNKF